MEIQRRICTLCLGKCETFKCIEINTRHILDLFLPKMDFTIIHEPVMCGNCAETLAKCFDFKTTCLHTYDYLVSFVNNKNDVKLDLNDLFQSRSMTDTDTREGQDICGFCMGQVKSCSAIPLYIKDEDYKLDKMVQQCLPELDLSIIKKPVICADCHSSLESCFRFVTDCLTSEQRIRLYLENLDIRSTSQIELSELLLPAIKTEKTNDMDSNFFDIVKIEKQISKDGENPEQNEMVGTVNIIKLEDTSCINENFNNINENVNESLMTLDNPKVSNEQQSSPNNVLVWEEEGNKLGAIKIEETLCEKNESKFKDDMFAEIEDKTCLINEEIEIKTEGHNFNRFEDVMTKARVNTRLNEKSLMPTLEERLSKPPIEQAFMKKKKLRMYSCYSCSFQTEHKNSLEKHLLAYKEHSEMNMYKCEYCSFQTKRKDGLLQHLLIHKVPTGLKEYKCDSCTFRTMRRSNFKRHLLKHTDISKVIMYTCDSCTFQTIYKDDLKRHSWKHKDPSEVTMYKCDSCTYQTINRGYLNQHSLKHKDPSEVVMYKCEFCTFQTNRRYSLNRHSLKHKNRSEVAMYKCDSCTYQTSHSGYFHIHSLKHKDCSDPKMYKCDYCTYQTPRRSLFHEHAQTHEVPLDQKMYKCDICTFQTIYKNSLKGHSLIHKDPSEVAMYKCDSCTFQTIYRKSLRGHLLKHADPAELTVYKCESCTYQTLNKGLLRQHYLKHKDSSEVTMYKCDSCTYQTRYRRVLKKHMARHTNSDGTVFKCDSCTYQTIYKCSFKEHSLKHKDDSSFLTCQISDHLASKDIH